MHLRRQIAALEERIVSLSLHAQAATAPAATAPAATAQAAAPAAALAAAASAVAGPSSGPQRPQRPQRGCSLGVISSIGGGSGGNIGV